MHPFCDIIVVHCGGNDMGKNKSPQDIADTYIECFKDKARVVVFCSVVGRLESSPHVYPDCKHLSQQFTTRLIYAQLIFSIYTTISTTLAIKLLSTSILMEFTLVNSIAPLIAP